MSYNPDFKNPSPHFLTNTYIIYRMCKSYGLTLPRRYRRNARKDYLAFVKSRKHTEKKVREGKVKRTAGAE